MLPSVHNTPHVLLHGFLGSARSWDEAPIDPNHKVAPNLFGHGPLPPVTAKTDFHSECQRILRLSPAGSHLLGYSMGARVALGLLTAAPSHFSSATLVAVNPGLQSAAERAERKMIEASWREQIKEHGLELFVDGWERLPIFESQLQLDRSLFERQRAIRTSHFDEGIVGCIESLGLGEMPALWERLSRVRVPVTLVCGARDEKFMSISGKVCDALPNARLEIIEDCGHNPVLEQPERFWKSI